MKNTKHEDCECDRHGQSPAAQHPRTWTACSGSHFLYKKCARLLALEEAQRDEVRAVDRKQQAAGRQRHARRQAPDHPRAGWAGSIT